jgi:hypothetical protein
MLGAFLGNLSHLKLPNYIHHLGKVGYNLIVSPLSGSLLLYCSSSVCRLLLLCCTVRSNGSMGKALSSLLLLFLIACVCLSTGSALAMKRILVTGGN